MDLLPRRDERLLRHVFRQVKITQYGIRTHIRHILKSRDEPVKRIMLFPERRIRTRNFCHQRPRVIHNIDCLSTH